MSAIGHIGLTVRDLDASVAFYTDLLGLRLTERFDYPDDEVGHGAQVSRGAFLRSGPTHHCISLFQTRETPRCDGNGPLLGLHHLAFEVRSAAELLELYRQFRDRGARIHDARKGGPGNQPRFYAFDPDENLLEFYWGIDEVGWMGVARAYDPIQSIDLEDFDFEAYLVERDRAAQEARLSLAAGNGAVVAQP